MYKNVLKRQKSYKQTKFFILLFKNLKKKNMIKITSFWSIGIEILQLVLQMSAVCISECINRVISFKWTQMSSYLVSILILIQSIYQ